MPTLRIILPKGLASLGGSGGHRLHYGSFTYCCLYSPRLLTTFCVLSSSYQELYRVKESKSQNGKGLPSLMRSPPEKLHDPCAAKTSNTSTNTMNLHLFLYSLLIFTLNSWLPKVTAFIAFQYYSNFYRMRFLYFLRATDFIKASRAKVCRLGGFRHRTSHSLDHP